MMSRVVVSLAFSFSLVACSSAPSHAAASSQTSPQASRAQVEGLLSGYEYMPSLDDLNRLGPGVTDRLVEISTDLGALNLHRMRALKLLAHYADQPKVHNFLDQFVDKTDQPFAYRRAALISLGSVPDGKSIPRIATFLHSPDIQVRSAAAQALAQTKDRQAATLLRQAAAAEKDSDLQQKMEQLTRTLEEGK